ncbi:MAG: SidA/IucD/PvdA family monooxygenase [Chitinophagaceae bacterium]
MKQPRIYDLAGLGIGPFNLGLAALCHPVTALKTIFFEQRAQFDWHKGMMLQSATLQVPFYADLVTLADPCSRFSFMAFLKASGRLFHFAIKENNFITRREYNQYCNWVAAQLSNLHFNHQVQIVQYNQTLKCYEIHVQDAVTQEDKIIYAKQLAIGVGMSPVLPEFARKLQGDNVFHSGEYLYHKDMLFKRENVSVVGSGQSAAEIFYDLLQDIDRLPKGMQWFTRSDRFFPMEYSKLSLEMTSPDYIDYFYNLPSHKKEEILARQKMLYKGINFDLIGAIYDYMYHKTIDTPVLNVGLYTNCELRGIDVNGEGSYTLSFYHREQQECFTHTSAAVVLATSYESQVPAFLQGIADRIRWNEKAKYDVQRNYSIGIHEKEIFVQNAELHTHGFNAPDLGMGAYRNSIILNEILGYEHYKLEKNIAFQTFGLPRQPQTDSKSYFRTLGYEQKGSSFQARAF